MRALLVSRSLNGAISIVSATARGMPAEFATGSGKGARAVGAMLMSA